MAHPLQNIDLPDILTLPQDPGLAISCFSMSFFTLVVYDSGRDKAHRFHSTDPHGLLRAARAFDPPLSGRVGPLPAYVIYSPDYVTRLAVGLRGEFYEDPMFATTASTPPAAA
jgi:hypothetical protein